MVTIQYWHPRPFEKILPADVAGYRRALAAVRKTPTPSRQAGKAYVRYWEKRLEFGIGYLEAIQTVKQAAIAEKATHDAKENGAQQGYQDNLGAAIRHAEIALRTMVGAIDTFAEVAKDRADAGAVATMGKFVYRPMKRKTEELQAEFAKLTVAPKDTR